MMGAASLQLYADEFRVVVQSGCKPSRSLVCDALVHEILVLLSLGVSTGYTTQGSQAHILMICRLGASEPLLAHL